MLKKLFSKNLDIIMKIVNTIKIKKKLVDKIIKYLKIYLFLIICYNYFRSKIQNISSLANILNRDNYCHILNKKILNNF